MSCNAEERRDGDPGRRWKDHSVCPVHNATLTEIGQVRSQFRWTLGLLVPIFATGIIAAALFLGGILKDFKCELTNIGKIQSGIAAKQEIILQQIKPFGYPSSGFLKPDGATANALVKER